MKRQRNGDDATRQGTLAFGQRGGIKVKKPPQTMLHSFFRRRDPSPSPPSPASSSPSPISSSLSSSSSSSSPSSSSPALPTASAKMERVESKVKSELVKSKVKSEQVEPNIKCENGRAKIEVSMTPPLPALPPLPPLRPLPALSPQFENAKQDSHSIPTSLPLLASSPSSLLTSSSSSSSPSSSSPPLASPPPPLPPTPTAQPPVEATLRQWRNTGDLPSIVRALGAHLQDRTLQLRGVQELSEYCLDDHESNCPETCFEAGGLGACLAALRAHPLACSLAWKACRFTLAMKGVGILVAAVRLAQGSDLALSVAFELQLHGLGALLELLTAGDGLGDQAKKDMRAIGGVGELVEFALTAFASDARGDMLREVGEPLLNALGDKGVIGDVRNEGTREGPRGNLKIAVISDTHGHHRQLTAVVSALEGIDVLVHCGNIQGTELITNDLDMHPLNERDNMTDFDAWLGGLTNIKHKVVVAGSYDTLLEARLRSWKHADTVFQNAYFLLGDRLEVEGWVFWGGPWSSQLPPSAGQDEVRAFTFAPREREADELRHKWAGIPSDTHVLITHTPPRAVFDDVNAGVVSFASSALAGCVELRAALAKMKKRPLLHVFGLVKEEQESRRRSQKGVGHFAPDQEALSDIRFANVASLQLSPKLQNLRGSAKTLRPPLIFECVADPLTIRQSTCSSS